MIPTLRCIIPHALARIISDTKIALPDRMRVEIRRVKVRGLIQNTIRCGLVPHQRAVLGATPDDWAPVVSADTVLHGESLLGEVSRLIQSL